MPNKVLGTILFAVLLLTPLYTFSATPSRTTEDMTRIDSIQTENGNDGYIIIYVRDEPTEFAVSTLNEFLTYKHKKKQIVDIFDEEVKTSILKCLPKKTNLDGMILSEFVSLGINEYISSFGDITATFQFPTVFTDKIPVVAVLGYLDEQARIVWAPLGAEVVSGTLVILFPCEVLLKAGQDVVLIILSDYS